jgi:hypothetical protein
MDEVLRRGPYRGTFPQRHRSPNEFGALAQLLAKSLFISFKQYSANNGGEYNGTADHCGNTGNFTNPDPCPSSANGPF